MSLSQESDVGHSHAENDKLNSYSSAQDFPFGPRESSKDPPASSPSKFHDNKEAQEDIPVRRNSVAYQPYSGTRFQTVSGNFLKINQSFPIIDETKGLKEEPKLKSSTKSVDPSKNIADFTAHPVFFEEEVALLKKHSIQEMASTYQSSSTHDLTARESISGRHNSFEVKASSLDEVISNLYDDDLKCDELDSEEKEMENQEPPHSKTVSIGVFFKNKKKFMMYHLVMFYMTLSLICGLIFSSFPLFTCQHPSQVCYPQLTVQLTDKSPAAKSALVTVKEALKVLTYLAIDFGDSTSELDMINNKLDSYYQDKIIDTFSVNTIYQLNFLGYCRLGSKNRRNFCMRSYGLDLLAIFVRDAGVQLGELTRTNVDIMGDSFAIAYELAISAFNQFTNKENHSVEYIDYAILLQKFSKGLGFLTVSQFGIGSILLLLTVGLMILKYNFGLKSFNPSKNYFLKKCILISMVSLSFLNLFTGFLICSLTFEYVLRLSEVGQSVGIANVNRAYGFSFIWLTLMFQVFSCCSTVYLANGFRRRVF